MGKRVAGNAGHREGFFRPLAWVELIKAVGLIGIFLNHLVERILDCPYIANPSQDWPPLWERIAQLKPLDGFGILDIPINLLRYIGWGGEHGVQLFLILSGFGLTWGLLSQPGDRPIPLRDFYSRRLVRIYPLWWGVHLFFIVLWVLLGFGLSLSRSATYLSMIGVRITPGLLYYFSPAWWFFGLILQLYLIYPLLWKVLRRIGPFSFLTIGLLVGFVGRSLGALVFGEYLDAWLRGAIFLTRLPEFVFGISLAAWLHRMPDQTDRWLRRPAILLASMLSLVAGGALALTLPGMAVAPFLLGVGAFVLLYAAFARTKSQIGTWIGRHSYSLYLLHHPLIFLFVPAGSAGVSAQGLLGTFAAVISTVILAVAFEHAFEKMLALLGHWYKEFGLRGAAFRITTFTAVLAVIPIGGELLVQRVAPQEVLGWGEKLSLEPDPILGWHLKPSCKTRLRWESYDYTVTGNSLGFPGPEYPVARPSGTLRVFTIGDAFTSAEGVDTDLAWPRLVEAKLSERLKPRKVEVLNFAITAYGPNQYAAIVKTFAPLYRPDLIIVGFFVNEYEDVQLDTEEYQGGIGFDSPASDGWYAILRLEHLRKLIRLEFADRVYEIRRRKPRGHGYFLGNFAALERGQEKLTVTGRNLVKERLAQIRRVADDVGAKVIILMIPAPVQICGADQLAYYPGYVNLNDSSKYDLDLPQRMTEELATTLRLGYHDLRPFLRSLNGECPYQRRNMHWTEAGHRAVAAHVAELLITERFVN
jgi:peptidoglycan/LPS O-acetylase OafA/YrhL